MDTSLIERIRARVEERRDTIVDRLVELIGIPTQAPPGENYDRIVDHVAPWLAEAGFDVERYVVPPEVFEERSRRTHPELTGVRSNLLARTPDSNRPRAAFYCHLDTVPVGDAAAWTSDPFRGLVRDGFVWGRGSADPKAGVVAITEAFAVLRELGLECQISPVVALTTDEEVGPYTGLMHMADTGVFDGCRWLHSTDGPADSIGAGSMGSFTWSIHVEGKSVHTGRSFLGVNPIEHSAVLLEELLRLKAEVDEQRSALAAGPEMVEVSGRTHLTPTFNVTIARAGVKHNVVPPAFTLEGDRRYLPEEAEAECYDRLLEAVARAQERDPELRCTVERRPFYTSFAHGPEQAAWIEHVSRVVSTIRGHEVPPAGLSGSTDTAHVGRVTGMSVTHHGVGRLGSAGTRNHGVDERCGIQDLLDVTTSVAVLASAAADV